MQRWHDTVSWARLHAPGALDRAERAAFAIRRRKLPLFRFQVGSVRLAAVARDARHMRRLARALGAGALSREARWLRPSDALEQPPADADACWVEIPDWLAPRAASLGWLVVPKWVSHVQDLSPRLDELVVPAGLELRVTRNPRDLDRFHGQLYLPMLRRRHGELAAVTPLATLRHRAGDGWLVLVERAGMPVAGAFLAPGSERTICIDVIGRTEDATAPERKLVLAAAADLGRRWGFHQLDHLGSLPLLNDGLMQQKLAWRTRLTRPVGSRVAYALGVGPGAYELLKATPLVVLAGKGVAWLGEPSAVRGRTPRRTRQLPLPAAEGIASLARRLAPLPAAG